MLVKVHGRRTDEPENGDPLAPATGCLVWTLVLLLIYLLAATVWFIL